MFIFLAIMFLGLVITIGGSLLGHDHDHDIDHDHDAGHDHGHDAGHSNEPTVSMFSLKVIGTFIMGFGGGGFLARYYQWGMIQSSLAGIGVGVLMAMAMYFLMKLFYGQQVNTAIETSSIVGMSGVVFVGIDKGGLGKVTVYAKGQSQVYLARSSKGNAIAQGANVKVVVANGSEIVVDDDVV